MRFETKALHMWLWLKIYAKFRTFDPLLVQIREGLEKWLSKFYEFGLAPNL